MEKQSQPKETQLLQSMKLLDIPIPEEKYQFLESGTFISILSYNILADAFCYEPKKHLPKSCFNFSIRSALVIESITKANPDICILQEVDNLQTYSKAFKALGYELNYKNRVDGPDSVVVMYKKDKFRMVNFEGLDFNEGHPFTKIEKYEQNNVGVCVELIHKETQKKIVVLGCHLFWNPDLEQVKYLQVCMMVDYLQEKYSNGEIIFWGGDLNSKPLDNNVAYVVSRDEPLIERIEKADQKILRDEQSIYKAYKEFSSESNKYIEFENLYSMYGKATGNEEAFPKYTNYKPYFKGTLDHIFFNPQTAHPVQLLKIDEAEIEKKGGLPCTGFPSDHVPIMGVFLI